MFIIQQTHGNRRRASNIYNKKPSSDDIHLPIAERWRSLGALAAKFLDPISDKFFDHSSRPSIFPHNDVSFLKKILTLADRRWLYLRRLNIRVGYLRLQDVLSLLEAGGINSLFCELASYKIQQCINGACCFK